MCVNRTRLDDNKAVHCLSCCLRLKYTFGMIKHVTNPGDSRVQFGDVKRQDAGDSICQETDAVVQAHAWTIAFVGVEAKEPHGHGSQEPLGSKRLVVHLGEFARRLAVGVAAALVDLNKHGTVCPEPAPIGAPLGGVAACAPQHHVVHRRRGKPDGCRNHWTQQDFDAVRDFGVAFGTEVDPSAHAWVAENFVTTSVAEFLSH
jgi:hypothetical protein